MDDKYKLYLYDLGSLVKQIALEAKNDLYKNIDNKENVTYQEGYLSAMHRIISLMQQQCIGFGIDVKDLNIQDINPNKHLI